MTNASEGIVGRHFAQVARRYEGGRHYEKVDFWAQEALRLGRPGPGDRLLDVGSGTGLFACRLSQLWPGPTIGLDPSLPMLAQARQRTHTDVAAEDQAREPILLAGRAESLPFAGNSFRCIFASQAWHHFDDKALAAKELHRVLAIGGVLLIKTFSHDQLRRKPAFVFFPEMLASQLRAYTDVPELKDLLRAKGFSQVTESYHCWEGYATLCDYVEAAEGRLYSMYSCISDEVRQRGIQALRQMIQREGNAKVRNDDVNTLVVARK